MQVKGGTKNFNIEKQGSQQNPTITETIMTEMDDRKKEEQIPKGEEKWHHANFMPHSLLRFAIYSTSGTTHTWLAWSWLF